MPWPASFLKLSGAPKHVLLRAPRITHEKHNNPLTIIFYEHKIQTTDMETFPTVSR
jgi:hypothetical protein